MKKFFQLFVVLTTLTVFTAAAQDRLIEPGLLEDAPTEPREYR